MFTYGEGLLPGPFPCNLLLTMHIYCKGYGRDGLEPQKQYTRERKKEIAAFVLEHKWNEITYPEQEVLETFLHGGGHPWWSDVDIQGLLNQYSPLC